MSSLKPLQTLVATLTSPVRAIDLPAAVQVIKDYDFRYDSENIMAIGRFPSLAYVVPDCLSLLDTALADKNWGIGYDLSQENHLYNSINLAGSRRVIFFTHPSLKKNNHGHALGNMNTLLSFPGMQAAFGVEKVLHFSLGQVENG